jgi:hypothetical protein
VRKSTVSNDITQTQGRVERECCQWRKSGERIVDRGYHRGHGKCMPLVDFEKNVERMTVTVNNYGYNIFWKT